MAEPTEALPSTLTLSPVRTSSWQMSMIDQLQEKYVPPVQISARFERVKAVRVAERMGPLLRVTNSVSVLQSYRSSSWQIRFTMFKSHKARVAGVSHLKAVRVAGLPRRCLPSGPVTDRLKAPSLGRQ